MLYILHLSPSARYHPDNPALIWNALIVGSNAAADRTPTGPECPLAAATIVSAPQRVRAVGGTPPSRPTPDDERAQLRYCIVDILKHDISSQDVKSVCK